MIKINDIKIPYLASEITFNNYLDSLDCDNVLDAAKILTGVDFKDVYFYKYDRDRVAKNVIRNCGEYAAEKNEYYLHNDNLYLYPNLNDITLLEGILAMNYAKEYSSQKYSDKRKDAEYAMTLYLIATLSRKVVNGKVETKPTNISESLELIESRVAELHNISVKNAFDFTLYFSEFESKLQVPFYKRAFKSIHPIKGSSDNDANERFKRWSDFYGSWSIYENLKTQNMINGLDEPFFHCVFLHGLLSNK